MFINIRTKSYDFCYFLFSTLVWAEIFWYFSFLSWLIFSRPFKSPPVSLVINNSIEREKSAISESFVFICHFLRLVYRHFDNFMAKANYRVRFILRTLKFHPDYRKIDRYLVLRACLSLVISLSFLSFRSLILPAISPFVYSKSLLSSFFLLYPFPKNPLAALWMPQNVRGLTRFGN